MRRYCEAFKADVRRRMSPPHRQSVAQIPKELGIHVVTLYNWRKAWQLQGKVVPASEKEPEGWSAAETFTVLLETAGCCLPQFPTCAINLPVFQRPAKAAAGVTPGEAPA